MVSISEYLNLADIQKGDILDVASDVLSITLFFRKYGIKFSMDELLEELKKKVGSEGTLLIRCFNWDFCKGETFDYKRTKSQVGSLGNVALQREDFKRTQHPIYSWMVWGKDTEYLCSLENKKSFGKDTPWDYFEKNNAKLLRMGNALQPSFTHYHHIEQELNVPYRFEKVFKANYVDKEENVETREYSMFVRDLEKDIRNNDDCLYRMEKKGILKLEKYMDELQIFTIDLSTAYDLVRDDMLNGRSEEWVFVSEK